MDERITSRAVTFVWPFVLNGIDGELPAGNYTIETVEEPIAGLSFLAYRRVSTAIVLSTKGGRLTQIVMIDPQDLKAAEAHDASRSGPSLTTPADTNDVVPERHFASSTSPLTQAFALREGKHRTLEGMGIAKMLRLLLVQRPAKPFRF